MRYVWAFDSLVMITSSFCALFLFHETDYSSIETPPLPYPYQIMGLFRALHADLEKVSKWPQKSLYIDFSIK